jgi:hypothetical protein
MMGNHLPHLSLRAPLGAIATLVRPPRLVDGGASVGDGAYTPAVRDLSGVTREPAPTTLLNPPQLAPRQRGAYT